MRTIALLIVGLLLAASCGPLPDPQPPDPQPPPPDPAAACEAAGARLEALQCRFTNGLPTWRTPGGAPFAEACLMAYEDGRNWHPQCIAAITSCSEREAAYRGEVCNVAP